MTDETSWNVTVHSDSRMNRMTNIPNTGTYLAGVDKTKHGLLICTADGSGLIKDHVYLCTADGLSLIDLSGLSPHTHSGSTDGGSLERVFAKNNDVIDLLLTKTTDLYDPNWAAAVYWKTLLTSGGTIENNTDGTTGERAIRLRPNVTSGGAAQIQYPHLKLNFGKTATFTTKLRIETATNIALHAGVAADNITSADSNFRKFQAEVCTVTNNNWQLRTANGSANSASDTGIAISANRVDVSIDHNPTLATPEDDIWIGGVVFQKTSNIATGGATGDDNLIKFSVKNSTAADRPLLMYGARVSYTVSDAWAL